MKKDLRLSVIGSLIAILIAGSFILVSCDNDATNSTNEETKDKVAHQQDQDDDAKQQGQDMKKESSEMETMKGKTEKQVAEKKVYTIPDQMPEYPGGEKALMEYLKTNIEYPARAREERIEGKVYVSFTILPSGEVHDVTVVRGIGGGCDEEAARVVSEMPNWSPGYENNIAVEVEYHLPISFTLR